MVRTHTVDEEVRCVCLDALICGQRLLIERKVASNLITVKGGNALRSFSAKSDYSMRDTFSDYLYTQRSNSMPGVLILVVYGADF